MLYKIIEEDNNMANVNVTIRMDEQLRRDAAELFDDLGISLNQAITIFVRQAVREQRIPFDIYREIPNKETIEAFKEADDIESGKVNAKKYNNIDEMFDDILK